MKTPINMKMVGYEAIEKIAQGGGNSGRVYVPIDWIGKKVKIVLLEKIKDE